MTCAAGVEVRVVQRARGGEAKAKVRRRHAVFANLKKVWRVEATGHRLRFTAAEAVLAGTFCSVVPIWKKFGSGGPDARAGERTPEPVAGMSDDDWDTDADHVAPPDSKGTGAGQRAVENPFAQNRQHSEDVLEQKRQSSAEAVREAPKVVKRSGGGSIGGGGGEPCASCSKTVYPAEKVAAGKAVWHKDCFACGSCAKKLSLHSYRLDRTTNTPFCPAHLPAEDRGDRASPVSKLTPAAPAAASPAGAAPATAAPASPAPAVPSAAAAIQTQGGSPSAPRLISEKRTMSFGGGGEKCATCNKTAYAAEQIPAQGRIFHRACFRCTECR